jgi:sulfur-oxidizing protein SoxZ
MAGGIKIRAKEKGGVIQVKTLMKHPMETGVRKDSKTGELVPAHYIQEVKAEYDGRVVMTANWGPGISKNPYWSFKFRGGKKGDKIKISWTDNTGETASEEAEIK